VKLKTVLVLVALVGVVLIVVSSFLSLHAEAAGGCLIGVEETVAHALRDPSGAYAAMIDRHRPIGSPMFLPPAVEVIKR
jgi:hypothetical protein